jgi:hypothetical protein
VEEDFENVKPKKVFKITGIKVRSKKKYFEKFPEISYYYCSVRDLDPGSRFEKMLDPDPYPDPH